VSFEPRKVSASLFTEKLFSPSDSKGVQLFTLIAYLEFSFTIVNAFYFLITAVFRRHGQMGFIEKVQKIDETLRASFSIEMDYKRYKIISIVILMFILVYYNLAVSSVMFFFLLDITSTSGVSTFVIYIIQSATSGIFTYGFLCYVVVIAGRITVINKELAKIVQFPPEVLEKQYENKEAMYVDMMRYTKIYKSLCGCIDDLNQIYGSSMVLHFAHDFTLLTTQIFAMFYIGFFENAVESRYQLMALLVWLLPNIVKMSFICFNCHRTTNEVTKIAQNCRQSQQFLSSFI
jgi:7tm Chemosensory receptor